MGPLVAPLGHGGLDVSHPGHCIGLLVGLLRVGLGRLVVLGSGGERILSSLARECGADPLIGGDQRGLFRNWTIVLAITAFSLSLLGTFLVRSGVLTSVHAFATDPRRGVFILVFLIAVVGSS